jgi:predicted dehydrogenase
VLADPGRRTSVALAGGGIRATSHTSRILRAGGRVTAVSEPIRARQDHVVDRHRAADPDTPPPRRFPDWESMARHSERHGRLADAVLVATQDADHADAVERFAALGYDILCEKPMGATDDQAVRIVEAVTRADVLFAVCHTLRYTTYTRKLRTLLAAGRIGSIVSVQHLEPVGWWHFAHSYVRGNWRREADSASLLMAKCCHDIDWLGYIIGSRPVRVSSFGHLTHFRPENKPAGAGDRCCHCGVEPDCPYSAVRLYHSCIQEPRDRGLEHWPLGAVTDVPTRAALDATLADGPYGRCVYDCDNDVVDHQVVLLDYANGVTASHTVTAFTEMADRKTRIFGTHGCIDVDGDHLVVYDFRAGRAAPPETITPALADGISGAHADGDNNLVAAFLSAVASRDAATILSGPAESLASHRVVWAAERARATGTTITLSPEARRATSP